MYRHLLTPPSKFVMGFIEVNDGHRSVCAMTCRDAHCAVCLKLQGLSLGISITATSQLLERASRCHEVVAKLAVLQGKEYQPSKV